MKKATYIIGAMLLVATPAVWYGWNVHKKNWCKEKHIEIIRQYQTELLLINADARSDESTINSMKSIAKQSANSRALGLEISDGCCCWPGLE